MRLTKTFIAGSLLAFAIGSGGLFSTAFAADAMKAGNSMAAEGMKADCLKKAEMETDAMKKKSMEDECGKTSATSGDAMKAGDAMKSGDAMMAKPKQ